MIMTQAHGEMTSKAALTASKLAFIHPIWLRNFASATSPFTCTLSFFSDIHDIVNRTTLTNHALNRGPRWDFDRRRHVVIYVDVTLDIIATSLLLLVTEESTAKQT